MKILKKIVFLLSLLILMVLSTPLHAASPITPIHTNNSVTPMDGFLTGSPFYEYKGANGVTYIINLAIAAFLSMMGIVFLILLVIAGYKYMNAQGDEKAVTESLKSIKHATIGLVIVISAYAITYFVFSNLPGGKMTIQDTNSSSGTGQ